MSRKLRIRHVLSCWNIINLKLLGLEAKRVVNDLQNSEISITPKYSTYPFFNSCLLFWFNIIPFASIQHIPNHFVASFCLYWHITVRELINCYLGTIRILRRLLDFKYWFNGKLEAEMIIIKVRQHSVTRQELRLDNKCIWSQNVMRVSSWSILWQRSMQASNNCWFWSG